jgi:hypothetical protein
LDEQQELFGELAEETPYNHYCRKNLGYLFAIMNGAECILETDDDNIPYSEFGSEIGEKKYGDIVSGSRWINIYKYFTNEHIWPRGLPLDEIYSFGNKGLNKDERKYPIQQYLADGDPDVDAVYRLVIDKEIFFEKNKSIGIAKDCWVPFNSQNTVFFKSAFPLLYLPCHVSFRMTDIWRSFVAQKALWIFDKEIAFHSSTVRQVRNQHSLIHDFSDEIPGYLNNKKITELLDECSLALNKSMDMSYVVRKMWEKLSSAGIIPSEELQIYDSWSTLLKKQIN